VDAFNDVVVLGCVSDETIGGSNLGTDPSNPVDGTSTEITHTGNCIQRYRANTRDSLFW